MMSIKAKKKNTDNQCHEENIHKIFDTGKENYPVSSAKKKTNNSSVKKLSGKRKVSSAVRESLSVSALDFDPIPRTQPHQEISMFNQSLGTI